MANISTTVRQLSAPAQAGVPVFEDASTLTTPGVSQTLISTVVPAGKKWTASQVIVACRIEASFTIEASGLIIGSGRTGAAQPMGVFTWSPGREIASGASVEIKLVARAGSPAASVEAYWQALETTN